ncbi:ASCH domain-containing protein [Shewanella baltica]|uniref:ASCH domain-containing protein n=1 Tax=Shewanella baltica TaxID=62322 RepID=UPI00217EA9D3|nr:ASCH domain-containing protein [Shewanella baltica]MCS6241525.1 ASCH domain-containing protein [Shewanella baltica]
MKQRPIIFNTEMVQAIVDGRKTQTRRQMNPQPKPDTETSQGGYWFPCAAFQSMVHVEDFQHPFSRGMASDACPICSVGDQLYVRETFADCGSRLTYKADKNDGAHCVVKRWTPSIHMPRSCARILLEVTAVRVERLDDISEQDAKAEGFDYPAVPGMGWKLNAKHNFLFAWDKIYGNRSSNPFVWVIEFKVISTTGGAA